MELLTDFGSLIQKWPLSVVVVVSLNLIGFALKRAGFFPNRCIPLTLIVLGSGIYALVGDYTRMSPEWRHPVAVLALYGVILGFIAWGLHKRLLQPLAKLFTGNPNSFDTDPPFHPPTK